MHLTTQQIKAKEERREMLAQLPSSSLDTRGRKQAVFSGSSSAGSGGARDVFTLQKRQPRVHVSPITMIVAVAVPFLPPQHSPMFGHLASSHTLANFDPRSPLRIRLYSAPPGFATRSQSGFGSVCFRRTRFSEAVESVSDASSLSASRSAASRAPRDDAGAAAVEKQREEEAARTRCRSIADVL